MKGQLICDHFKQLSKAASTHFFLYETKSERFRCRAADSETAKAAVDGFLVFDEERQLFSVFKPDVSYRGKSRLNEYFSIASEIF